ncbi:MAG: hypothetical protein AAF394_10090, partial [Planctomycetota bacterium]
MKVPQTQAFRHLGIALGSAFAFLLLSTSHLAAQESDLSRPYFRSVITIAGNGQPGPPRERGPALEVPLSNPFGVQPEADGSLIIASFDQHVLFRLDANYRRLDLIAGSGKQGLSGRSGDFPRKIMFNAPHEIQVDPQGNIFVSDTSNHRVGKINAETGRWEPVAGTGEMGFAGDEGDAVDAKLNQAYSIAIDGNDLFISDLKNHRIRKVDLKLGTIDTICGTGTKAMPSDGKKALEQPLAGPRSLAVDKDNLWIVLREGNSVWRIDRQTELIHHVAGTGKKGFTGDGGPAREATFKGPKGIAVDPETA